MKTLIILVFITSLSVFSNINAQQKRVVLSPNAGLFFPFLDKGIGVNLGINSHYPVLPWLSAEGQLSYGFVRINSAFISGIQRTLTYGNFLVGLRLYLTSSEKSNRFYVNSLIGLNLNKYDSFSIETLRGLSFGAYYTFRDYSIGLSMESPGGFILKASKNF